MYLVRVPFEAPCSSKPPDCHRGPVIRTIQTVPWWLWQHYLSQHITGHKSIASLTHKPTASTNTKYTATTTISAQWFKPPPANIFNVRAAQLPTEISENRTSRSITVMSRALWQLDCFFNSLFKIITKKTKFHNTGVCERNPPVTGGLRSQWASHTETVSISRHLHDHPQSYSCLHNSYRCLGTQSSKTSKAKESTHEVLHITCLIPYK